MTEPIDETQNPLFPLQDRHLRRLACARSDVSAALQACELVLQRNPDGPLRAELFAAVVISYVRPFTHNDPMGPLAGTWRRFKDVRLQRTHGILWRLRHDVVAHTKKVRIFVVRRGVLVDGAKTDRLGVRIVHDVYRPSWFADVRDTCEDLRARLDAQVGERLEKLYGHLPELPGVPWDAVR